MSVLSIVRSVCAQLNFPLPGNAVASADPRVVQLLALLGDIRADLEQRSFSANNVHTATWTSSATDTNQGYLKLLCPKGFKGIVQDTFWNVTTGEPYDPLGPRESAAVRRSMASSRTSRVYWTQRGYLNVSPVPPVGQQMQLEYLSNWFFSREVTTTPPGGAPFVTVEYKYAPTQDDDELLLGDDVGVRWLLWKYRAVKGLPYGEDQAQYEALVRQQVARQTPDETVDLAESGTRFKGSNLLVG